MAAESATPVGGAQDTLVSPRSYQLDLFQRAKKGNVIAVLDTGSGKTLISLLLMKHVLQEEANTRAHPRPCIFLVPLVPLVLQQEAYIRNNCTARVRHYYGAMGVDSWPAAKWSEALQQADVMVMTADIFKLLLNRNYLTMADVSLIVFDEAHHARKNHSYNQIMSLHYTRCSESQRPKIFGMTASPTCAKEDSRKSIEQLERNLNCKAFTAPPGAVAAHVSKAQEEVLWYTGTSNADPPGIFFLIQHVAGAARPLVEPLLKTTLEVCETLGPWAAEISLEQGIIDAEKKLAEKRFQRQHNAHLRVGIDEQEQLAIAESLLNLKNYITTSPHAVSGNRTPDFGSVSPKVAALVKLLQSYRENTDGFCAIVFVERRATAKILSEILSRFPGLEFIKHGVLVGHGLGGGSLVDPNMTIQQQHKIVEKFRSGQYNVLIATKVAEEGLDIKMCMLVIRFDGGATLTNFIQSRGRARHAKSRFVIMADKLNPVAAIDAVSLQQEELLMREELSGRDKGELDHLFDSQLKLTPEMVFTVESTGASLTLFESIGALFHYCSSLPQDNYVDSKPVFQEYSGNGGFGASGGYFCSVTLPMTAPLSIRFVEGQFCRRKQDAKRWAAFEAMKRLYAAGELDDRLKPLKLTTVMGNDEIVNEAIALARNSSNPPSAKENPIKEFTMGTPHALAGTWNNPVAGAWLAKIKIRTSLNEDYQSIDFGILTTGERPLPGDAFTIRFAEGTTLDVCIVPLPGSRIVLAAAQITAVKRFHAVVFKGMLRSQVPDDGDWTMIVVPLLKSAIAADDINGDNAIDWEVANSASKEMTPVPDLPDLLARPDIDQFVLFDRIHYRRVYLVDKVLSQLTPTSDFPSGNGKFQNLATFYKVRLGCKEDIVTDQPIIQARVLPRITQGAREDQTLHAAYLIPQFCQVYPLPARLLRGHALHLPAVMQHVQLRLLAMELKCESFCNSGDDEEYRELAATIDDIQSALTAPVTQSVDNYERFETYGDSFLKVHQTVHLFASQPTWHEGLLSQARNHLERNSALRARASKLHLERFISGTPLTRRAWVPPLQNDGGGLVQRFSDKMVADVVEALIGACVHTGGTVGGAKAVRKILGGTYHIDWAEYKKMLLKVQEEPSTAAIAFCNFRDSVVREVEQNIGYQFRERILAVEALTHASALQRASEVNSYQRLEFLGDAVLGYVITRYLFNLEPALKPGDLTKLRSELVNNQFLSCVAWRIKLPQMLEHLDSSLASAIAEFGELFDAVLEERCLNPKQGETQLFWTSLALGPKAAGDVYEAMLGAVFLDSGFDTDIVWRVVKKTLIDPWWHYFAALGLENLTAAASHMIPCPPKPASTLTAVTGAAASPEVAQIPQRKPTPESLENLVTAEPHMIPCPPKPASTLTAPVTGPEASPEAAQILPRKPASELLENLVAAAPHMIPCPPKPTSTHTAPVTVAQTLLRTSAPESSPLPAPTSHSEFTAPAVNQALASVVRVTRSSTPPQAIPCSTAEVNNSSESVAQATVRLPTRPQAPSPPASRTPSELQQISNWAQMNGCLEIKTR
ncbi:Dicer-like protein 1 [Geranomyces michiganensis]|nr:Dicer-like protein 1 [Geranomyces michiganensis]